MNRLKHRERERGSSDPLSIVLTILVGGGIYYFGMWLIDYMWAEKEHRKSEYLDEPVEKYSRKDEMGYSY